MSKDEIIFGIICGVGMFATKIMQPDYPIAFLIGFLTCFLSFKIASLYEVKGE